VWFVQVSKRVYDWKIIFIWLYNLDIIYEYTKKIKQKVEHWFLIFFVVLGHYNMMVLKYGIIIPVNSKK